MTPLQRAARNNALLCDAVCRAHGSGGRFQGTLWIHPGTLPRFYPNAVTLADASAAAEQLAGIRTLALAGIPGEWGVKDSFHALDLAPLGFRVGFDAEWIWRALSRPAPGGLADDVRWSRIATSGALEEWEHAFGAAPPGTAARAAQARVFLPPLLADPDVAFLAARHAGRIVAGAIANRGAEVVGFSNFFARGPDAARFGAGCLARTLETFPGLPVVGYGSGSALDAAHALGFESIGPLRVWLRVPERA